MVKVFRKGGETSSNGNVVSADVREKLLLVIKALVIVAAAKWIYLPALHGDWLWDDNIDITQNAITQSPQGLWSIWFQPGSQIDYYPIKSTVQWVQWQLWGNDTFGYHLTNLVLHTVNALLVWRLFSKLGLPLAWVGGLLFAIHPTMVESVAWIAELKNTLSLPFFLGAVFFYLDYDAQGKRIHYLLALGLFILAMLCKPTMVAFPFVILLYAWWKRNRVDGCDFKACLPFLIVSLLMGLNTIWVGSYYRHHEHLVMEAVPLGGFFSRLALAGLSIAFYFSKSVLPINLMPVYPQWPVNPPSLIQFLPWPILIGALYWLWMKRQGWGKHALFGIGFFLIILAPFVTINVGGYTTFTWVMDHFLYIPIIGLIGLVLAGVGQIGARLTPALRPVGTGLLGLVFVLLIWESHSYAGCFVNQEMLWTYTLKHDPGNPLAQNSVGCALVEKREFSEGMEHLREAIRLRPDYVHAYNNLGIALAETGDNAQAIAEFQQALKLNPTSVEAHNNLGKEFIHLNRLPEAGEQFVAIIKNNPNDASAYVNAGNVLMQMQRASAAMEYYQQSLAIDPSNARTHERLGIALASMGKLTEAKDQFQLAVQLQPDSVSAHFNLAHALEDSGQLAEAISQYETVLRYDPSNEAAQAQLARLREQPESKK